MSKIINSLHSSFEIVKDKFLNEVNEEATNKEVVLALIQAASNLAIAEAIQNLTDEVYEIKYHLEHLNK